MSFGVNNMTYYYKNTTKTPPYLCTYNDEKPIFEDVNMEEISEEEYKELLNIWYPKKEEPEEEEG